MIRVEAKDELEGQEDDDSSTLAEGWRGPKSKPVPIGIMNLKADKLNSLEESKEISVKYLDTEISSKQLQSFDIELPDIKPDASNSIKVKEPVFKSLFGKFSSTYR